MRVIVFVKATASSEAGVMPGKQLLADMHAYNGQLVHAGIMKDGAGLRPTRDAVRVRFAGSERIVIDGPFAETKELVSGYWIWEVASMAQAVEWLKKCPNPMPETSEVEIRPYYEAADFAEIAPDLPAQEAGLRQEAAMHLTVVQPYLFFGGRCEEALAFYTTALNAKVGDVLRWESCPEPPPPGMLKPGYEKKVMHSSFTVGGMVLFASDGCGEAASFNGFRIALTVAGEAVADRVFNALADGGRVDMPLVKTFWSPRYGMVTDRFGLGWMVMVPGTAPGTESCR